MCQYCTYRDGCEAYPVIDLPDADALYAKYRDIMIAVAGVDISIMCRKPDYVYARYFVVNRLCQDGVSPKEIERVVGLDRCMTVYARNRVSFVLEHRNMYARENKIYDNFIKNI